MLSKLITEVKLSFRRQTNPMWERKRNIDFNGFSLESREPALLKTWLVVLFDSKKVVVHANQITITKSVRSTNQGKWCLPVCTKLYWSMFGSNRSFNKVSLFKIKFLKSSKNVTVKTRLTKVFWNLKNNFCFLLTDKN